MHGYNSDNIYLRVGAALTLSDLGLEGEGEAPATAGNETDKATQYTYTRYNSIHMSSMGKIL